MNENNKVNNSDWSNFSKNNLSDPGEKPKREWKLEYGNIKSNISDLIINARQSRKLVLLVVFIALFFDNMLLTTVGKIEFEVLKKNQFKIFNFILISIIINLVPIIPEYLLELDHPNLTQELENIHYGNISRNVINSNTNLSSLKLTKNESILAIGILIFLITINL